MQKSRGFPRPTTPPTVCDSRYCRKHRLSDLVRFDLRIDGRECFNTRFAENEDLSHAACEPPIRFISRIAPCAVHRVATTPGNGELREERTPADLLRPPLPALCVALGGVYPPICVPTAAGPNAPAWCRKVWSDRSDVPGPSCRGALWKPIYRPYRDPTWYLDP